MKIAEPYTDTKFLHIIDINCVSGIILFYKTDVFRNNLLLCYFTCYIILKTTELGQEIVLSVDLFRFKIGQMLIFKTIYNTMVHTLEKHI